MNNPIHRQRIMKSGWLRKQGGMVRTWHRRWFCLNGDCLFYFTKEDDLRPQGSIFLPGTKITEIQWTPDDSDKYLFEISPGKAQAKALQNQDTIQLCAQNNDERQSWMKAIRKVIYSDLGGAIFGQSIEETMMYEHRFKRKIPFLVEESVEFLLKYGLEVEGLFRLPGRTTLIKELKDRFDCAEKIKFNLNDHDVHSVASLLKMYFRELPESIIPSSNFQKLLNIAMNFQDAKDDEAKTEAIKKAEASMTLLPEDNFHIVKYLCTFLKNVGDKSNVNKMTVLNLATVFGPNIIRNVIEADSPELMMATADLTQQLAFMLISNCDVIFTEKNNEPEVPVDNLLDLSPIADEPKPLPRVSIENNAPKARYSSLLTSVTEELKRGGNPILQPISASNLNSISETSSEVNKPSNLDLDASPQNNNNNLLPLIEEGKSDKRKPVPPARRKKKTQNGGDTSPNSSHSPHSPLSRNNSLDFSEGDVVQELKMEIDRLKTDLKNTQEDCDLKLLNMKEFYENRILEIKNSYTQKIGVLRTNSENSERIYKDRIESLNLTSSGQLEELKRELEIEKTNRSEALNKVMLLQTELNRYHLQYGQLH